MPRWGLRPLAGFLWLVLGCQAIPDATAQEARVDSPSEHFVHWAFAAYFGSGWYQAGDRQEVYALRINPRWKLDGPDWSMEGQPPIRVELRLPVTVGLYNLDVQDPGEAIDVDNLAAASVTPGIAVEIPVSQRWTLRPHVYTGWGTELDGGEDAWIYWAGLKSRYAFGGPGHPWSLLNAISFLGHDPSEGNSSDFVGLMAGLEFESGSPFSLPGGTPLRLHWHGTYTAYVDRLRFRLGSLSQARVAEEWEFGLSASRGRGEIEVWRLSFDRIGLAYRFTSSGKFEAISLVFSSVFAR